MHLVPPPVQAAGHSLARVNAHQSALATPQLQVPGYTPARLNGHQSALATPSSSDRRSTAGEHREFITSPSPSPEVTIDKSQRGVIRRGLALIIVHTTVITSGGRTMPYDEVASKIKSVNACCPLLRSLAKAPNADDDEQKMAYELMRLIDFMNEHPGEVEVDDDAKVSTGKGKEPLRSYGTKTARVGIREEPTRSLRAASEALEKCKEPARSMRATSEPVGKGKKAARGLSAALKSLDKGKEASRRWDSATETTKGESSRSARVTFDFLGDEDLDNLSINNDILETDSD